ncbi:hypothetical protein HanRHA438_Chr17g0836391 [Helianthus annuus]|uniref:Uncharacterized protein n=1 Tax=Helianthus annuus TaxID=4232 RepID=A0A9K3DMH7_HELAN|nr:hypothetical protein HanXRQr2_Chr17g0826071 [Helianthus annuus]KAJ0449208.1 hypothetical protein HanHA89_Chr17g0725841 [Helianthus annuus]KAJ0637860.1 hypothetical protein HanOQP8_Chr17g0678751 [Helianthus annuus]KAJ0828365.1 hypothetical protein HanRHA438_Chr17g0836391 [Helianthus annuus]
MMCLLNCFLCSYKCCMLLKLNCFLHFRFLVFRVQCCCIVFESKVLSTFQVSIGYNDVFFKLFFFFLQMLYNFEFKVLTFHFFRISWCVFHTVLFVFTNIVERLASIVVLLCSALTYQLIVDICKEKVAVEVYEETFIEAKNFYSPEKGTTVTRPHFSCALCPVCFQSVPPVMKVTTISVYHFEYNSSNYFLIICHFAGLPACTFLFRLGSLIHDLFDLVNTDTLIV